MFLGKTFGLSPTIKAFFDCSVRRDIHLPCYPLFLEPSCSMILQIFFLHKKLYTVFLNPTLSNTHGTWEGIFFVKMVNYSKNINKLNLYWNDRIFSTQILRPFTSCNHTCITSDPRFVIFSCQVSFLVLISNHSVTTSSALKGTHVRELQEQGWSPSSLN